MPHFKGKKESSKESTVQTAVALQDHMTRYLSLEYPVKKKTPGHNNSSKSKTATTLKPTNEKPNKSKTLLSTMGVERVLDPVPKPLTLAQKIGVVAAPEPPLTELQWSQVKSASNSRDDSLQPCAICQEHFSITEQVLLSCSHVFHRVCLHSFEKYSCKKTCPMCRKEEYQTRLIYEGTRVHLEKSAIRIQAHWRGYMIRRWYKKIRENVAPNDLSLRKAFFENKLTCLTERVLNSLARSENEVDSLINAADQNISYSRNVLSQVKGHRTTDFVNWKEIRARAQALKIYECPICMTLFGDQEALKEPRPIALLSCSHVFHFMCLQMYEDCYLSTNSHCPVCRTMYLKRKLSSLSSENIQL